MLSKNIKFSHKYFKSDSIPHGRNIKSFFERLITRVVTQSEKYYEDFEKIAGNTDGETLPICYNEVVQYSQFGAAISTITNIHLSEFPFNRSEQELSNRKLDFWCVVKDGDYAKALNYFIELKTSYYCVDGNSDDLTASANDTLQILLDQIADIKNIKPLWAGDDNIYLGIMTFHGYKSKVKSGKEVIDNYYSSDLENSIWSAMDKRKKPNLLFGSVELPIALQDQWERNLCKFVGFAGVILQAQK